MLNLLRRKAGAAAEGEPSAGSPSAAGEPSAGSYASHATAALAAAAAAADGGAAAARASRRQPVGRDVRGASVAVDVDDLLPNEGREIPVREGERGRGRRGGCCC